MALRLIIILALAAAQILGPVLIARCGPRATRGSCDEQATCISCACPCCETPSAPSRPEPATPDQNPNHRWLSVLLMPPVPRIVIPLDATSPMLGVPAESVRVQFVARVQSLHCSWLT